MNKKIELLAPVGSMANLKAAVCKGADAVYLGMNRFSARDFATNFNEKYLKEAANICKSNGVKLFLTMNTLIKNNEVRDFFNQLSYAYSRGIDSVIIQEISFLDIIKKNYPDLRVHISTQAGVINSRHANMLSRADRITLARELTKSEVKHIRHNFNKEIEVFCHGALCVCLSGSCLLSSLIGGRSGNRGKCAQPCRYKYNDCYFLSTKELCLIEKIPEIISLGVDSMKIEGRMRSPNYVATATEIYRKAIDSCYAGNFSITPKMKSDLFNAFNREFTTGWFDSSKDMFNVKEGSSKRFVEKKEHYDVRFNDVKIDRHRVKADIPEISFKKSSGKKLLVRVYSMQDAIDASEAGADIVYVDLFDPDFCKIKEKIKAEVFAVTPRIMLDSDFDIVIKMIKEKNPDGILAGNIGMIGLDIPVHLDYNSNVFNDFDLNYFLNKKTMPIISPELSFRELKDFKNKNFAVLVHGKLRLMTLRHNLSGGWITDSTKAKFKIAPILHGTELLNGKELGLLGKSNQLLNSGIDKFFIDTDQDVREIVKLYRDVLDGKKVNDSKLRKKYVLGWSYRGVI